MQSGMLSSQTNAKLLVLEFKGVQLVLRYGVSPKFNPNQLHVPALYAELVR